MYMLRRIYKTQSRAARTVATLVRQQQDIYESAGRNAGHVYFNPGTLPGETDTVVLEWTAETLGSPFLSDPPIPSEALELGGEIRKHIESQRIEFWELMTPAKMERI